MRLELMEGETTRKRKIANIEYEEEEEDEDVKMEKFFALIRSTKDIRDQLLDAEGSQPRATKAVATTEKKAEAVARKDKEKVKEKEKVKGTPVSQPPKTNVVFGKPPSATVTATGGGGRSGGSGGGSGGRISNKTSSEEEKGKKTAEYKKNYQGGSRFALDLNLSL